MWENWNFSCNYKNFLLSHDVTILSRNYKKSLKKFQMFKFERQIDLLRPDVFTDQLILNRFYHHQCVWGRVVRSGALYAASSNPPDVRQCLTIKSDVDHATWVVNLQTSGRLQVSAGVSRTRRRLLYNEILTDI